MYIVWNVYLQNGYSMYSLLSILCLALPCEVLLFLYRVWQSSEKLCVSLHHLSLRQIPCCQVFQILIFPLQFTRQLNEFQLLNVYQDPYFCPFRLLCAL